MIKVCKKHGSTKHSGGKYKRCQKCAVEAVSRRREKVKKMAVDYKGGECENCGYHECIEALEFHHKDPSQKDFSIGSGSHNHSWVVVKSELDKCLMLCANCHRHLHFLQRNAPFV